MPIRTRSAVLLGTLLFAAAMAAGTPPSGIAAVPQRAPADRLTQQPTADRLVLTRPLEDFPLGRMAEAVKEHAHLLAQLESGTPRSVEAAVARNIENGGAAIIAHMQSTRELAFSAA